VEADLVLGCGNHFANSRETLQNLACAIISHRVHPGLLSCTFDRLGIRIGENQRPNGLVDDHQLVDAATTSESLIVALLTAHRLVEGWHGLLAPTNGLVSNILRLIPRRQLPGVAPGRPLWIQAQL